MKIHLSNPIRRRVAGWTLVTAASVLLAACSGSNDQNSSTTTPAVPPPTAASVPASAVADIGTFISYLNILASADFQEPLLTDAVTPPTTETGDVTII